MFSMNPIVDLLWSFGGFAVILERVSRIETRDGVIQLPVSVTSQKRRFCGGAMLVFVFLGSEVKWEGVCENLLLHR